jgi:hypothetical protein
MLVSHGADHRSTPDLVADTNIVKEEGAAMLALVLSTPPQRPLQDVFAVPDCRQEQLFFE